MTTSDPAAPCGRVMRISEPLFRHAPVSIGESVQRSCGRPWRQKQGFEALLAPGQERRGRKDAYVQNPRTPDAGPTVFEISVPRPRPGTHNNAQDNFPLEMFARTSCKSAINAFCAALDRNGVKACAFATFAYPAIGSSVSSVL